MLNRVQHKTLIEIADALIRIAECLEAQTGHKPSQPIKRRPQPELSDDFFDDRFHSTSHHLSVWWHPAV
jgi:hypothetical protein